jgi:hypothetical protein
LFNTTAHDFTRRRSKAQARLARGDVKVATGRIAKALPKQSLEGVAENSHQPVLDAGHHS